MLVFLWCLCVVLFSLLLFFFPLRGMFSITCREPYVIAAMVTIAKAIMKTVAMSSTIALTIAAMFHRYLNIDNASFKCSSS